MKTARAFALILGVVSAAGGIEACTSSPASDTMEPVLSVPIIDLSLLTDFLPFGSDLGGHLNAAYELYTRPDTATVRAASAGIVAEIAPNEAPQTDLEIRIRPTSGSIYLLIYDHVVSPLVVVGQSVAAGQAIGRIGLFDNPGPIRIGRVELQINRGNGSAAIAICPRDFGTAAFNAAHAAALLAFPTRGTNVCLVDTVAP